MNDTLGIIILAAGMGKRMKSDKAKVLHEVAGRPMINYVVETASIVAGSNVVVVVGHQAESVKETVRRSHDVLFATQPEQRGTGHAVACALPVVPGKVEHVIVLCGDVPLIQPDTIKQLIEDHQGNERDITILATRVEDPTGYGRLVIQDDGELAAIVEQADASEEQKTIDVINTGFMAIKMTFLTHALPLLGADNAQNEIYLTDLVGIGRHEQRKVGVMIGENPEQYAGVNTLMDLAGVEKTIKNR